MDKKIIYQEVQKLQGGVHRKGFELLVSATELVIESPLMGTIKLYHTLAKEFNDTPSRVERALRYYVQCIMTDGNHEQVSKLNIKFNKRGTVIVTEFVRAFALYLKMNF